MSVRAMTRTSITATLDFDPEDCHRGAQRLGPEALVKAQRVAERCFIRLAAKRHGEVVISQQVVDGTARPLYMYSGGLRAS
jgi:hypothetical protein